MTQHSANITVFYDAACPSCVNDRRLYQRLAGAGGRSVHWFDITGQDEALQKLGIDPLTALTELHVQNEQGVIIAELDAYILLMSRVVWLRPLALFIGLPLIKPMLSRLYHQRVMKRLKHSGRI
ncbi:DUF393 domain-containing protein [Thalassotalea sp. Y01]|uniref:thiol-disulfide oxidoreductase DCC family protein n=1 Tax=Thalassotalea sp. Y01 TaxID=2729613 RepID=UPI00145FB47E|nr:DUF393 domain-containing protein [Thalassotalea sp. Y01]NMP17950.1 DUF393 domain-containing protein [Thalassotalea sp. Y01]